MGLVSQQLDGVELLTLDFPPMNAFGIDAMQELVDYFSGFSSEKPLVITGAGRAFSAGVDTGLFQSYGSQERATLFQAISQMTAALVAIKSPVIAAVNGHAMGGGLVMVLCTDYRLAAIGDARFGLTEARAGVPFPEGPLAVITSVLAPDLLRRLTLSSAIVSAADLAHRGVFDELTDPTVLLEGALARARELAGQPAFREVKEQVRGGLAKRLARIVAA